MRKAIPICLLLLISKLYVGNYEQLLRSIEPAKELAEHIREKHQGKDGFMEDCDRCKGLDYCLVCPGLRKVLKRSRRAT